MTEDKVLEGEWIQGNGGKGGGAHTPVEASDTLYSRQVVRILFALSEGEVENEPPTIYLNKINSTNFTTVTASRYGLADQPVINGFVVTESSVSSATEQVFNSNTGYTPPLAYDLTTTPRRYSISKDYEASRVTLTLGQLRMVTGNGDMVGYSVSISIYTRITGGTWTLFTDSVKSGKCSSPYSWDVLVPRPDMSTVPSATTWEIAFIRNTQDDPNTKYMSSSYVSSIIGINYTSHQYNNTALLALTLTDAEQFSGKVPDIVFRKKGIKVKVPDNYDPVTHTYSGSWLGGLKKNSSGIEVSLYSCNPAWCLYNVLTRSKANGGLEIPSSSIDITSFYNLGVYADNLVSDGSIAGTKERRYELHNQFSARESVPVFLSYILSLCNANFTTNEFGQISLMYDHAGQAITKQVTNTNVIDGIFIYSSNDIEARYSIANVTYNNSGDLGSTSTTSEFDDNLIARYGLQSIDIVLVGCLSEAQAKRKARWALYVNSYTPEFVTFKVLLAGMTYQIGELVNVYDNYIVTDGYSGSIVSTYFNTIFNTTVISLDRPVTLPTGVFSLSYYNADGNIVSTVIQETNITIQSVTVAGNISILTGSPFILSSSSTGATVYKVVKIEVSDNIHSILCSKHDENKYSYIESGVSVVSSAYDFVSQSNFTCPSVVNISVSPQFFIDRLINKSILHVVWEMPSGTTITPKYKLSWKRDNQQLTVVNDITVASYDLIDPIAGNYEFSIWAVNTSSGITSNVTTLVYSYRTSVANSSLLPPTNIYVTGTTGTEFSTPDLSISFKYNLSNDLAEDTLQDYIVEVADTNLVVKGTYNIPVLLRTRDFINNIGYEPNVVTASIITKVILDNGVINVTKIGITNAEDGQSYFSNGITSRCRVRGQFLDVTKSCKFGLNSGTYLTAIPGVNIPYRFKLNTNASVECLVGTGTKYILNNVTSDDVFEIEWTGVGFGVINFIYNNVIVYSYTQNNSDSSNLGGSLSNFTIAYGDSSFITSRSGLKNFTFGTFDTSTNLGGTFHLPFETNRAIFGTPTRNFKLKVYSRDMIGDLSTYSLVNITNTTPQVSEFSFTVINGVGVAYIKIVKTNTASNDMVGFRVWQRLSSNTGFTPSTTNWVYDGSDTYISISATGNAEYTYYVAAYDTFDKNNLVLSSPLTGMPLSMDSAGWAISSGINFTSNASTHILSWTSGTIVRGGISYSISSGSTTWSSGIKYIYFNPAISITVLQAGVSLGTSVDVGCFPIATYTGGNNTTIKGGSGDGFISGSQLLAGTVGTSQLIAGSVTASILDATNAVITGTAQIATGVVTDILKSSAYDPLTKTGWKLDKAGNMISYGALTIESSGIGNSRMVNNGDSIKVYDASGVLRVKLGNLT